MLELLSEQIEWLKDFRDKWVSVLSHDVLFDLENRIDRLEESHELVSEYCLKRAKEDRVIR